MSELDGAILRWTAVWIAHLCLTAVSWPQLRWGWRAWMVLVALSIPVRVWHGEPALATALHAGTYLAILLGAAWVLRARRAGVLFEQASSHRARLPGLALRRRQGSRDDT
jgi:hypothetical protein